MHDYFLTLTIVNRNLIRSYKCRKNQFAFINYLKKKICLQEHVANNNYLIINEKIVVQFM